MSSTPSPPMAALLFHELPGGEEAFRIRLEAAGVAARSGPVAPHSEWALELRHSEWGGARLVGPSPQVQASLLPGEVPRDPHLTREEAHAIGTARAAVTVMLADERPRSGLAALRDRKRLLRFAREALNGDGLGVVDLDAQRLWSTEELEDELSHSADLDVDGIHVTHAVHGDGLDARVDWLHSHGLAAVGGFDFDVVNPCRSLLDEGCPALRTLAFAILEGAVALSGPSFLMAEPGGLVRFVPAEEFDRRVPAALRGGRQSESVRDHLAGRAVLCDPVGVLGRLLGRCRPSQFLARDFAQGTVFRLSHRATEVLTERARLTLPLLRRLHEELGGPAPLLKLRYDTPSGGAEHLWFEVHRFLGDRIDATLTNQPWDVPGLQQGRRGEFELERTSDWLLPCQRGMISPRSQAAARRLRVEGADAPRERS